MGKKKMIKIISISKDRQSCIDINSTIYSLSEIETLIANGIEISVSVAFNKKKNRKYIRYKRNCKEKIFENYTHSSSQKSLDFDYGKSVYKMTLIIEDKGSANNLIIKILDYYAKVRNIHLICNYITSGGNAYLSYNIARRVYNKNVLVIYDNAEDIDNINDLIDTLQFMHIQNNYNFITFSPRCIEECALSFKNLSNDIKFISNDNLELLNQIFDYFYSGKDYIYYDFINSCYVYNEKPILLGSIIHTYKSKTINTLEQWLCYKLLDITFGKPYYFDKAVSHCWLNDCNSLQAVCSFEEKIGIKNPNKTILNNCNKYLIGTNKIENIIDNSLFGGIIDSLDLLFFGKNNNTKLNNILMNKLIRRI